MNEMTNSVTALQSASRADFLEAIETLGKVAASAEPPHEEWPRMCWNTIIEIPSVFQIRDAQIDERHLSAIQDLLKRGGDLKPLTVWHCGGAAVLIDGHYRLRAYRQAQGRERLTEGVPVVWLTGSLDDAIRAAADANADVKLPLDTRQRMNFAWRLVLLDRYSKAETAKIAGISKRAVALMRSARMQLEKSGVSREDIPTSWLQASRDARRLDVNKRVLDYDEFKHEQAQAWADKLAKTFSTRLAKSPEITALALGIYLGSKAAEIAKLILVEVGDPLQQQIEDEWLVDCPF